MSWSGHRATTQKTFEMSEDKDKVIKFAKKFHRNDPDGFYVAKIEDKYWTSVSQFDYDLYNYAENGCEIEHYLFINGRWKNVTEKP